ncbi:hypothetical protein [Parabacteroides sp.]
MIGQLYIDGRDAYTDFGVWITEGGYDGLLPFPELVEPDRNDWPDEDGIEPDLEKPTLKPRELNITFVRSVYGRSAGGFVEYLSTPGYHLFRIHSLGREWSLRLIQGPAYEDWDMLESFTLRFTEDRPVRPSVISGPNGGGLYIPSSEYELDGVSLERYGIMVMEGKDEIMRSPTVKTNLSRTILNVDGRIYDADNVVFNSKEVTLKCCLIADSTDRFWRCYDALLNALIQPGERSLYVDYNVEEYPCYYKRTSGWKLESLRGRVVVTFNLTLEFTVFRMDGIDYLLATEAGELVVTEDGEYYIDLNTYA